MDQNSLFQPVFPEYSGRVRFFLVERHQLVPQNGSPQCVENALLLGEASPRSERESNFRDNPIQRYRVRD